MTRSLAIVSAALLATASWSAAAATSLAPHQAFYSIKLRSADQGSNISSANGGMSQEWNQSCEGWSLNERFVANFETNDGGVSNWNITSSSFENADSSDYNFTSKSTVNGEVTREFRGRARRARPGAPVEATYVMPAGQSLILPADTVFPIGHTRLLLAAAQSGETRLSRPFFEGPEPDNSPFEANALILGEARPADEGSGSGLGPMTERPWWPIRVAYFSGGSQDPEPSFELAADLQDNGVVRAYRLDYGDFVLEAELVRIEALEVPACQ